MKFEAGRYYRTRSGRKVYIIADHNPFYPDAMYRLFGYFEGALKPDSWREDGRCVFEESPDDLIDEWREPETHTVYVYRSPPGVLLPFMNRDRDNLPGYKLVTILSGPEGTGLEAKGTA